MNTPTRAELVAARFRHLHHVLDGAREEHADTEHDHRGPDPCPVCGGTRPEDQ